MKIKDLLEDISTPFCTIEKRETVKQALKLMSENHLSGLVVMEEKEPQGIFTERDLVRCHTLFPDKEISRIFIKDVMTTTRIVVEPENTVNDAMGMMIKARIRHLPVVHQREIIGILCLEDLAKIHVGELTHELHYLKDYISDLQDAAHD